MSQDLVEVYVATGLPEANLVKSYLEANGIPVMAVQEGAGAAYGITVGILGEVRLLVIERQAEEAKQLIEGMAIDQSQDTTDQPPNSI